MEKSTGIVYQIKNLETGKSYIGCTTSNFGIRVAQHIRNIGKLETELYWDMNKDIKNFCFSVIEDNVLYNELRNRESYWINHFQSVTSGYNQVFFSGNEKLSKDNVWEIKDLIINTNLKFLEIANYFDISNDAIADINLGRAWFEELNEYPLRKSTIKTKKLLEKDVHDIYNLLRDESMSFQEITEEYGWSSQSVLRKINNGTYRISPLNEDSYPIRGVDSRRGRKAKDNGMF